MHLHDLALAALACVSEFLGTLSGFGSSTFFLPLGVLVEKFQFILALTAILHCFGNVSRIFIFKEKPKFKMLLWLILPSVVLTGAGAMLTAYFNAELLKNSLGWVLVALGILLFFGHKLLRQMPSWAAYFLNAFSGLITGFVGTGGALRGVALSALSVEKSAFVLVSSMIDVGGDFLRAGIYISNGYMDWTQWFYIPLLSVAAYFGSKLGQRVLARINQSQFERIVAVFVIASGLVLVR